MLILDTYFKNYCTERVVRIVFILMNTTVFFEKDNKYSDKIYLDRSHKYFSKKTFQKFASIIKNSNLKYCNYKRKIFIFNYYYIIFKKKILQHRPQFKIKYLYIILNC